MCSSVLCTCNCDRTVPNWIRPLHFPLSCMPLTPSPQATARSTTAVRDCPSSLLLLPCLKTEKGMGRQSGSRSAPRKGPQTIQPSCSKFVPARPTDVCRTRHIAVCHSLLDCAWKRDSEGNVLSFAAFLLSDRLQHFQPPIHTDRSLWEDQSSLSRNQVSVRRRRSAQSFQKGYSLFQQQQQHHGRQRRTGLHLLSVRHRSIRSCLPEKPIFFKT